MYVDDTILFGWIVVAHWFACVFYALGWVWRCQPGGEATDTWLTIYWPQLRLDCADLVVGGGIGGEAQVTVARRCVRLLLS